MQRLSCPPSLPPCLSTVGLLLWIDAAQERGGGGKHTMFSSIGRVAGRMGSLSGQAQPDPAKLSL